MAKEKLSPRQRMINLMYLVFIAMLAMTIGQEIIMSYNDTVKSLTETRNLTQQKNKMFEQALEEKAKSSPESFSQTLSDYRQFKSKISDLVSFIDVAKGEMLKSAGVGSDTEDFNFNAYNNAEASTQFFFDKGNEASPSKNALELKKKIDDLRTFITTTFKNYPDREVQALIARANKTLVTEFDKKRSDNKNWLVYKFHNQPLVAALANLEVIQTEASNLESDVLANMLKEKVDADIKFNTYEAIVAGPTVVLAGQKAEATVVIGTYDNTFPVTITGVDRTQNGKGFKSLNTSGAGTQVFSGNISFSDSKGKVFNLPFRHEYQVIAGAQEVKLQSGAIVAADKMNVLYRGISNPISASMLGVDNSTVRLSAAGASVSRGNGKWNIVPGGGTTVNVTVSGTMPNGKVTTATFPFRIKNIPPPQGQIRGSSVVSMPASSIPNQTVSATIPDFDFPVSFTVTGFKFKAPGKPVVTVGGSSLSAVANAVKGLQSGDIAYVYDIKVSASGLGDMQMKQVPPVVINVQ